MDAEDTQGQSHLRLRHYGRVRGYSTPSSHFLPKITNLATFSPSGMKSKYKNPTSTSTSNPSTLMTTSTSTPPFPASHLQNTMRVLKDDIESNNHVHFKVDLTDSDRDVTRITLLSSRNRPVSSNQRTRSRQRPSTRPRATTLSGISVKHSVQHHYLDSSHLVQTEKSPHHAPKSPTRDIRHGVEEGLHFSLPFAHTPSSPSTLLDASTLMETSLFIGSDRNELIEAILGDGTILFKREGGQSYASTRKLAAANKPFSLSPGDVHKETHRQAILSNPTNRACQTMLHSKFKLDEVAEDRKRRMSANESVASEWKGYKSSQPSKRSSWEKKDNVIDNKDDPDVGYDLGVSLKDYGNVPPLLEPPNEVFLVGKAGVVNYSSYEMWVAAYFDDKETQRLHTIVWNACILVRKYTLKRVNLIGSRMTKLAKGHANIGQFVPIACCEYRHKVAKKIFSPGQRFKGLDRREVATRVIQHHWRMHLKRTHSNKSAEYSSAVSVISALWIKRLRAKAMLGKHAVSLEQAALYHQQALQHVAQTWHMEMCFNPATMVHLLSCSLSKFCRNSWNEFEAIEGRQCCRILDAIAKNIHVTIILPTSFSDSAINVFSELISECSPENSESTFGVVVPAYKDFFQPHHLPLSRVLNYSYPTLLALDFENFPRRRTFLCTLNAANLEDLKTCEATKWPALASPIESLQVFSSAVSTFSFLVANNISCVLHQSVKAGSLIKELCSVFARLIVENLEVDEWYLVLDDAFDSYGRILLRPKLFLPSYEYALKQRNYFGATWVKGSQEQMSSQSRVTRDLLTMLEKIVAASPSQHEYVFVTKEEFASKIIEHSLEVGCILMSSPKEMEISSRTSTYSVNGDDMAKSKAKSKLHQQQDETFLTLPSPAFTTMHSTIMIDMFVSPASAKMVITGVWEKVHIEKDMGFMIASSVVFISPPRLMHHDRTAVLADVWKQAELVGEKLVEEGTVGHCSVEFALEKIEMHAPASHESYSRGSMSFSHKRRRSSCKNILFTKKGTRSRRTSTLFDSKPVEEVHGTVVNVDLRLSDAFAATRWVKCFGFNEDDETDDDTSRRRSSNVSMLNPRRGSSFLHNDKCKRDSYMMRRSTLFSMAADIADSLEFDEGEGVDVDAMDFPPNRIGSLFAPGVKTSKEYSTIDGMHVIVCPHFQDKRAEPIQTHVMSQMLRIKGLLDMTQHHGVTLLPAHPNKSDRLSFVAFSSSFEDARSRAVAMLEGLEFELHGGRSHHVDDNNDNNDAVETHHEEYHHPFNNRRHHPHSTKQLLEYLMQL
eukprot:m.82173 g.82173  ORF g.82173 m.82173 type:complete len:1287 (-) comp8663_c0_seq2:1048-4908(-)